MLHERIKVLVDYVAAVVAGMFSLLSLSLGNNSHSSKFHPAGNAQKDPEILRSLSALIASLPASENPLFRDEFDTVC